MDNQMSKLPKTLVVGLGNPLLGDDGIGWIVAEQISKEIYHPNIEIQFLARGGLYLMERMIGYERVILIDAFSSPEAKTGEIRHFPLDSLPHITTHYTVSSHDTSLPLALDLGRSLGFELPEDIQVVAIASQVHFDVQTGLTSPVAAAVPRACEMVLELLDQNSTDQFGGEASSSTAS